MSVGEEVCYIENWGCWVMTRTCEMVSRPLHDEHVSVRPQLNTSKKLK